jgi:hypothetical protein
MDQNGKNMDEMISTKRENAAIDQLIAMAVEEIADAEKRDPSDVIPEFLGSHTAEMLYDTSTKLWWDGPSSVAERYFNELHKQQ